MAYVVSVITEEGQALYLRRAHNTYPVLTPHRHMARKFPTKADARAAIVKTGLARVQIEGRGKDET